MLDRWLKLIQKLPKIDQIDQQTVSSAENSHQSQFAPEYSGKTYELMIKQ